MTPRHHPVLRRLIAAAALLAVIEAMGATTTPTTVDARYERGGTTAVDRAPAVSRTPDASVADSRAVMLYERQPGPMTLSRVWLLQREMALAAPDPDPAPTPAPAPSASVAKAPAARSTSSRSASRPPWVALQLRIPELGTTQTTRSYPCDRVRPPANYVYRWGRSGANNLHLLGHAYSVFKPLHDAYAAGRLRVGMAAYWTDSKGRTITYRVTAWRVIRPDDPDWAIARQAVPSMTLQTCYGTTASTA